jgi:ParB-like chromosome segregation protein Spo0J
VDTKAGIIAGHGRLLAAQKLGLTEVPVIVLDHLTEAQKRAYIIADKRSGIDSDVAPVAQVKSRPAAQEAGS